MYRSQSATVAVSSVTVGGYGGAVIPYGYEDGYSETLPHKVTFASGWTAAKAHTLRRLEATSGPQPRGRAVTGQTRQQ